jgi:hypothetical protein
MFEWKRLLSGVFGDSPKECCGVKFEKPETTPAVAADPVVARSCCSGSSAVSSSPVRAQPGAEIRAVASPRQPTG